MTALPPQPHAAPSLQALIDRAPIRPVQVQVALLCALVTLVEGIDLNLIPLLAPAIAKGWSLPPSAFGIIFSSGPVGLILGGLGVGWLADRIGRRNALIGAMALMTLGTLATAFTRDVPQLLACRLATGMGFGGVVPAAAALVSEFLPTRARAYVISLVILGQSVGGLVAASALKAGLGTIAWQTVVLYMTGLCVAAAAVIALGLPESPRYLLLRDAQDAALGRLLGRLGLSERPSPEAEAGGEAGHTRLAALFADGRAPGTLLLWGTFIGACSTVSFYTRWLTLIYTAAGRPAGDGVTASAAYWAGGIVSGLVLPLFAFRWHVNKVLLAAILGAAAFTAAQGTTLGLGSAMSVQLPLAFGCGFFASGAFYLLYPPAAHFYPTDIRSTGIGAAVAFGRIGNTLSPLAAGLMLGAGLGAAPVFVAMTGPLLLSAVALVVFHRLTGKGT